MIKIKLNKKQRGILYEFTKPLCYIYDMHRLVYSIRYSELKNNKYYIFNMTEIMIVNKQELGIFLVNALEKGYTIR